MNKRLCTICRINMSLLKCISTRNMHLKMANNFLKINTLDQMNVLQWSFNSKQYLWILEDAKKFKRLDLNIVASQIFDISNMTRLTTMDLIKISFSHSFL